MPSGVEKCPVESSCERVFKVELRSTLQVSPGEIFELKLLQNNEFAANLMD